MIRIDSVNLFNLALSSCHSLILCLQKQSLAKLQVLSAVKVPGWKTRGLNPYFSKGTGCHVNLLGGVDYPLGILMVSALIQVVYVNQLFPVVLARRVAIISPGQWWEIDSLKHTVTGK